MYVDRFDALGGSKHANSHTRNTIFAFTGKAIVKGKTLSRKSEGGEGDVTDGLLRRVTTASIKAGQIDLR